MDARYSGIGATLQKKDGAVLITGVFDGSPAKEAGLKPGDTIVAVDGKPTAGLSLEAAISLIKGPAGTKVTLTIKPADGSPERKVTLTRREISIPIVSQKMMAKDGIKVGYVELAEFSDGAGEEVRKAVETLQRKGARWIVFDLRYDPGGYLSEAIDVGSDFIKSGVIVTTQGLHSPEEVLRANGDLATSLPMVTLVNAYTASASEIVSGALQDHGRSVLIGTRTFGKGLVQSMYPMPGGALLKLTTAVYLTPNGRDINKKGIEPNIVVRDDPKKKGDEQLDAALDYIAAHR
jgi:carboxyl-terminal processing protease